MTLTGITAKRWCRHREKTAVIVAGRPRPIRAINFFGLAVIKGSRVQATQGDSEWVMTAVECAPK